MSEQAKLTREQAKLTREQAAKLADELIAAEPRFKNSNFANVVTVLEDWYSGIPERELGSEISPLCVDQFRDLGGMYKHKA